MLKFRKLAGLCALSMSVLMLIACDIVPLDDKGKPILPMAEGEAESLKHMAPKDIAEQIWPDVYKTVQSSAIAWSGLESLTGQGNSFFVKFIGKIEQLEMKKNLTLVSLSSVDEVLPLQFGPRVKGNAVRDATAFIVFDHYKDQVQFAKLSKFLNKKAVKELEKWDENWRGRSVELIAAITISDSKITHAVPIIVRTKP